MKILFCKAVIVVFLFAWSSLEAQNAPVLTLADAVAEALKNNDRLLNQHDVSKQSELGVRLARNEFRPKVTPNILGSFGQTNVTSQTYRMDLSQRFVTGTEVRLGVGAASAQIPGQPGSDSDISFYNADTTLTLTQPLLRGAGKSVVKRGLIDADVRRADAVSDQTLAEQQVATEVAEAYYRIVAQQSFLAVTKQSLERSRKLRDASAAKLEAGLVSQLDVLRAEQLAAQAEMQLFAAESSAEDAFDQLRFLIGRTAGDPFAVETQIPNPQTDPIDLSRATSIALANRLDLKSRVVERADADRQIRVSRNQLLPQFDVNLALTRRRVSDTFSGSFGLTGFEFATFFTIAMPVDRTAQQVAHQSAVIARERRERDLRTMERQIADDVKRAVRTLDTLARSITAAETSVQISRKEVEVAQFRYDRGLSNNLDVVSAETALLLAESRRIQALADAAVARLRFRAVLGILNPRIDVAAPVVPSPVATGTPDR